MSLKERIVKRINDSVNAEMIIDYINSDITPFLLYLGDKGITPKMYAVKRDQSMECYKIIGPSDSILVQLVGGRQNDGIRLNNVLHYSVLPELIAVYKKLGFKVGYLCKFPVIHNDLHTANVVVVNGDPFIIDWGKGYLTTPEAHNARSIESIKEEPDTEMLIEYTELELESYDRIDFLPELKNAYFNGLEKGYASESDFNLEETLELTNALYQVSEIIFMQYFSRSRF